MQRILVLAYDFAPYVSIAAQRPESWLKYLPDNGLDVTVVTRHWNANTNSVVDFIRPSEFQSVTTEEVSNKSRVVRVPFTPSLRDRIILKYGLQRLVFVRRLLSVLYSIGKFFIKGLDDTYPIYKEADKQLAANKYDCIVATGEPFILFKHADALSRKHNVKWIADFRDCWSVTPVEKGKGLAQRITSAIFRGIEERVVASATLITTPSPSYIPFLKQVHPSIPIKVIYNGYNIGNLEELHQVQHSKAVFEIAYAGIFYPHQRLELFLDGVKAFVVKSGIKNLRITFYGINFYQDMVDRARNYAPELKQYIKTTDRMPYNEVMHKLREANILLLLTDEGANWLNAKVFDYLALQMPILLVKDDKGILNNILKESETGYVCSSIEDVAESINEVYTDYFIGSKEFSSPKRIDLYSRKQQAQVFAETIKQLTR